MSHFTVGVLIEKGGKDLEELLAPYQENNMGDCPEEYLEFYEYDEKKYEKYKDKYKTLDEFMLNYHGCEKDKKTGKYGYWENPNAQWDWYSVGGRWSNSLLKKDGTRCDCAQLKDIDWETMRDLATKKAEKTWDSNPQGIERYFNGIEKNDTRETFVERRSNFETYAVITPDGEWHSKGKMGWFGCGSETAEESDNWSKNFYDAFIKDADNELTLVVVDCHI